MRRGDFHYLGGRQGGVQRGLENDKLSGAADVPVGIQIDGDLLEYKEGASSKGPFRQVTMEGGGRPFFSEMFYQAVVQEVLLFRTETWVLSAEMAKNMEKVYMVFLQQAEGKTERQQWDGNWRRAVAGSFLR